MTNFIYDTQKALGNLQDKVIGLFVMNGTDYIDLVVEVDGDLIKTVHVSSLAAASVTHLPANKGKLVMFENGKTLTDMKREPFKLQDLCDEVRPNKRPKIHFPTVEEMKCSSCKAVTGHSIVNGKWTCVHCNTPL